MTAHFAVVAFALMTAGAAILIIAGLAHGGRQGKGRHLHLFPDLADEPAVAAPVRKETPEKPAVSADARNPRSRPYEKEKPKKSRRSEEKRRERRRAKRGTRAAKAETGDAGFPQGQPRTG